jgi:hypothetical protein
MSRIGFERPRDPTAVVYGQGDQQGSFADLITTAEKVRFFFSGPYKWALLPGVDEQ